VDGTDATVLLLEAGGPGEGPQSWDVLAGAGALAHFAAFLKFDARPALGT
jgi:hypothetical protein